jgi:hypothetical protein
MKRFLLYYRNRFRRVSLAQLSVLWEFLEQNRDIASAFNRSLEAKAYSNKKWSEISLTLNAVGDGVHKDWRGWCKVHTLYMPVSGCQPLSHHHQPINAPTAGAQAFLMDYPQGERAITHHAGPVQIGGC